MRRKQLGARRAAAVRRAHVNLVLRILVGRGKGIEEPIAVCLESPAIIRVVGHHQHLLRPGAATRTFIRLDLPDHGPQFRRRQHRQPPNRHLRHPVVAHEVDKATVTDEETIRRPHHERGHETVTITADVPIIIGPLSDQHHITGRRLLPAVIGVCQEGLDRFR